MKLHRYVDHQRLHIVTKDVISLSISVLLLFRHYISHKITFGAPSSGGVFCSACGAFIFQSTYSTQPPLLKTFSSLEENEEYEVKVAAFSQYGASVPSYTVDVATKCEYLISVEASLFVSFDSLRSINNL